MMAPGRKRTTTPTKGPRKRIICLYCYVSVCCWRCSLSPLATVSSRHTEGKSFSGKLENLPPTPTSVRLTRSLWHLCRRQFRFHFLFGILFEFWSMVRRVLWTEFPARFGLNFPFVRVRNSSESVRRSTMFGMHIHGTSGSQWNYISAPNNEFNFGRTSSSFLQLIPIRHIAQWW